MYKCLECGHVFDEEDVAEWEESRGEYWGSPCYEKMSGCPVCHGEYEEAKICLICGRLCNDSEINYGICDDCIDSYTFKFEKCYELSIGEYEEVKINSLVASILDNGDINQILVEYIRKNLPDIDCSNFINYDRSWFAEQISKEKNKNG